MNSREQLVAKINGKLMTKLDKFITERASTKNLAAKGRAAAGDSGKNMDIVKQKAKYTIQERFKQMRASSR